MNDFLASLADDLPPDTQSPPMQALWWLKKGDLSLGPEWEAAHDICQSAEGTKAYDWVHALAHWIEGDESNADYWYRRIGESRGRKTIADEWEYLVAAIGA